MHYSTRSILSAVSLAASFTVASTAFAMGWSQDFGAPSDETSATRVITVNPDTRWVNVERDETVKIVNASNGKSFAWHFDTPAMVFDLAAVAPTDVLDGRHIQAYVEGYSEVGD
ncbi:MAG TPA: CzcE family metal-binding protein [Burkholderiales bacterium]|nr:CzcE family metal-binding protein [Burkholderiales bacterium]